MIKKIMYYNINFSLICNKKNSISNSDYTFHLRKANALIVRKKYHLKIGLSNV